jgi:hypothetical protein
MERHLIFLDFVDGLERDCYLLVVDRMMEYFFLGFFFLLLFSIENELLIIWCLKV